MPGASAMTCLAPEIASRRASMPGEAAFRAASFSTLRGCVIHLAGYPNPRVSVRPPFKVVTDTGWKASLSYAHYPWISKGRLQGHFGTVGGIVAGLRNVVRRQVPGCPADPDVIVGVEVI